MQPIRMDFDCFTGRQQVGRKVRKTSRQFRFLPFACAHCGRDCGNAGDLGRHTTRRHPKSREEMISAGVISPAA